MEKCLNPDGETLDSKSQHCQLKGLSGFLVGITDHLLMDALLHEHGHMATTAALKVQTVQTQGTLRLKEGWCTSKSAIMNICGMLNLRFITTFIYPLIVECFR